MFRDIRVIELGRLGTELHPAVEQLLGLCDRMKTPADFHPRRIIVGSRDRQTVQRDFLGQRNLVVRTADTEPGWKDVRNLFFTLRMDHLVCLGSNRL